MIENELSKAICRMVGAADRSWMPQAKCKGLDPNLFHSDRGDHHTQKQALLICNGDQRPVKTRIGVILVGEPPCPVVKECLAFAVSLPASEDTVGVYGGKSHKQRSILRRKLGGQQRPKPSCGTLAGYRWHRRHGEPTCDACRQANSQRKSADKMDHKNDGKP